MSGWNTIESDAGLFTELVERLGVSGVEFEELWSLDEELLKQTNPKGVVFLFKYTKRLYGHDLITGGSYDPEAASSVFFAHQKIQNACATQAILCLLLNLRDTINVGPELSQFHDFTESFDPDMRGDTISNYDNIREVHNSFSRPNPFVDDEQQEPQNEDDDGLYHFITYVRANDKFYELDGLREFPISHGPCLSQEEFIEMLPKVVQQRAEVAPAGETRYSMLALVEDRREFYKAIGDEVRLSQEFEKRADWSRENTLRRQNFIGLIHQLVSGVSAKETDEQWAKRLESAREKSREVMRKQRSNA